MIHFSLVNVFFVQQAKFQDRMHVHVFYFDKETSAYDRILTLPIQSAVSK